MNNCVVEKSVVAVLSLECFSKAFENIIKGDVAVGKSCCGAILKRTCFNMSETCVGAECPEYIFPVNIFIRELCNISPEASALLNKIMERSNVSMRSYDKIIKIAQTIADLAESDVILPEHVLEASHFRSLDKKYNV